MKIKQNIVNYFREQEENFSIDRVALATALNIEAKDYQLFFKALNELEKDMQLRRKKDGTYLLFDEKKYTVGLIHTHRKGFGFVTVEGEEEDLFVAPDCLGNALDGDTVLVQKIVDPQHKDKFAAIVIKVQAHADQTLVGEVQAFNAKYYRIRTDSSSYLGDVFIIKADNPTVVLGHKVVVRSNNFLITGKIIATVEEIIGHVSDPGVDILSIVKKFNIPTEFSSKIAKELETVPSEVLGIDMSERVDIRKRQIVTIDGADAKDLDDAISLIILENGNYELGVHIADVSHYVQKGTAIDEEALARGTSVYLADRVIPMLPHQLSNGVCSLNPNVDRLTLTCDMEIDTDGNVVNTGVYQSIIHSSARMTYVDVNTLLEKKDEKLANKYTAFLELFERMDVLAKILAKKRHTRGSLDFEIDEAKIIVDEVGKAIDVKVRERGVAEKIIEQFMIEANESIAAVFMKKAWPFIYRVHATPKESKLDIFREVAGNMGVNVGKLKDTSALTPKILQDILSEIAGKTEHSLLATLLLRTMQKAEYSTDNIGHFGLAAENYTHFTSPIRRYPDLIVHRSVRAFICQQSVQEKDFVVLLGELAEIAKHTSIMERKAIECEREVTSMKMAEYMEDHIGEQFEGIISGVTNSGIFVELPNMVEGHISMETLTDDFYAYVPEHLMLLGRRTAKQYRMGDAIKVELAYASKKTSTIQFVIQGMTVDAYNRGRRDFKQGVTRDRNENKPYVRTPRPVTKENEAYKRRKEEQGQRGERREGDRGGYQGNRSGERREGDRRGYQGNRSGERREGDRGGYQGNRSGERREGDRGGYQGNRSGERREGDRGGYQGNRSGERREGDRGGYQGNRSGERREGDRGGYQGNRSGERREGDRGGYQGNRSGEKREGNRGGYQGNRSGERREGDRGGYQGNRSGERREGNLGGYQGNRKNQQTDNKKEYTDKKNK